MPKPTRQIVASGGGSFAADTENPAQELYILAQARSRNPSVCFIGTATGDSAQYIAKYYAAFAKLRCRPSHFPLFERTPDPRTLLDYDVIYVGGGNTKSMLAAWHDWELPKFLRQAYDRGTVLAGVSAGAICWFETGVTDSWAGSLKPLPCLGWLPGACCPHYDGEKDRRPSTQDLVSRGQLPETLALDDGALAHFVGRKLLRVVSSRANAGACRIGPAGPHGAGRFVETPIEVTRLDSSGRLERSGSR
jgi:dipeptidase E